MGSFYFILTHTVSKIQQNLWSAPKVREIKLINIQPQNSLESIPLSVNIIACYKPAKTYIFITLNTIN